MVAVGRAFIRFAAKLFKCKSSFPQKEPRSHSEVEADAGNSPGVSRHREQLTGSATCLGIGFRRRDVKWETSGLGALPASA